MKTFVKLLFFMAFLGFVLACDKADESVDNMANTDLKSAESREFTVPFKADFTVRDHSDFTDVSCGEPPVFKLTMVGEGNINHMGQITAEMTFCCNTESGAYWDTNCKFVAANGDELYATIPIGQIVPNEGNNSDYYQTCFNDTMYFVGGTGRFEGAEGKAMSNAFVHDAPEDWHTDFFSTGQLVLIKGKRK
jgi:hypothetical protein